MSVFDQSAQLRELVADYKGRLSELDEKASFYFENPDLREAWLIVQTQYQVMSSVIEKLEEILKS